MRAWLAWIRLVSSSLSNGSTWPSLVETKHMMVCVSMKCVQVKRTCMTLCCGQGWRLKLSLAPSGTYQRQMEVRKLPDFRTNCLICSPYSQTLSSPHLRDWTYRAAAVWWVSIKQRALFFFLWNLVFALEIRGGQPCMLTLDDPQLLFAQNSRR